MSQMMKNPYSRGKEGFSSTKVISRPGMGKAPRKKSKTAKNSKKGRKPLQDESMMDPASANNLSIFSAPRSKSEAMMLSNMGLSTSTMRMTPAQKTIDRLVLKVVSEDKISNVLNGELGFSSYLCFRNPTSFIAVQQCKGMTLVQNGEEIYTSQPSFKNSKFSKIQILVKKLTERPPF